MAARRATAALADNLTVEDVVDNATHSEGPLRIKSSGKKAERVVLFYIDDEEFSVPAKPGPNVTLKFLDEMRRTGNDMFAALGLLETMLGKEKYTKFLDYEELDQDLLNNVLGQVIDLAMSTVEGPAGK